MSAGHGDAGAPAAEAEADPQRAAAAPHLHPPPLHPRHGGLPPVSSDLVSRLNCIPLIISTKTNVYLFCLNII